MRAETDRASTARRVAGSAALLVTQYGAVTVLSALSTVALTRLLDPTGYGVYGTAIAAWTVLGATADLGTTTMLSRDLGQDSSNHRPMLRTAYEVSLSWSLILTLVLVAIALAAGTSTARGQALLVLAPSMLFNGFNPATGVFIAKYKTKQLLKINVLCVAAQCILTITFAASGLGVVAVAAAVSATSAVSSVWIAAAAGRLLSPGGSRSIARLVMVKQSVPLAILGVLTRVYGMVDLVLLGWYISGPHLGDYAASSKVLTVFAGLAGQVMSGALPGLAASIREGEDVGALTARVCHWLMVIALPLFAGLALFPSIVIAVLLGSKYQDAAGLIRILALYGALAIGTNLAANVLIAGRRMRPLYAQSLLAIGINVGANVLLIPRYGVYASAWITVVTEALVCGCSFYSARHQFSPSNLLRVALGPAVSLAIASASAIALSTQTEVGAVAAFILVFALGVYLLKSWPEELTLRRLRPR